jgi:nucleoside-triphosphatase THEP1
MRRHLFVTGHPGVGTCTLKSACLSNYSSLHSQPQAFTQKKVRSDGERLGFDVVSLVAAKY